MSIVIPTYQIQTCFNSVTWHFKTLPLYSQVAEMRNVTTSFDGGVLRRCTAVSLYALLSVVVWSAGFPRSV